MSRRRLLSTTARCALTWLLLSSAWACTEPPAARTPDLSESVSGASADSTARVADNAGAPAPDREPEPEPDRAVESPPRVVVPPPTNVRPLAETPEPAPATGPEHPTGRISAPDPRLSADEVRRMAEWSLQDGDSVGARAYLESLTAMGVDAARATADPSTMTPQPQTGGLVFEISRGATPGSGPANDVMEPLPDEASTVLVVTPSSPADVPPVSAAPMAVALAVPVSAPGAPRPPPAANDGESDPLREAQDARGAEQDLKAQRILAEAVAAEQRGDADAWLLLAEVAADRGDYPTAHHALEGARSAGAQPAVVQSLDQQIGVALRPRLVPDASSSGTGAGLTARGVGISATFHPGHGTADLGLTGSQTELTQGPASRRVSMVNLGSDAVLGGDDRRLGFRIGVEADSGELTPTGLLRMESEVANGSIISWQLSHQGAWRPSPGFDPLAGVRIQNLDLLQPGLSVTDFNLSGSIALWLRSTATLDAGISFYGDASDVNPSSNKKLYSSARWRWPLLNRTVRLAVEPNAYVDGHTGETPGMLSYRRYTSLGVRGIVGASVGSLDLEVEYNRYQYRYPDEGGVGSDVGGSLTLGVAGVDLEAGGALISQGLHDFHRVNLSLGVPIG